MIDEQYRELIHAEIDGDLSDRQRAELASYLLAHPEARVFRDDLRQVCESLDRIEQVMPPAGLRESILRALHIPQSRGGPGAGFGIGSVFTRAPMAMRYAAAILAALVIGTVAYQLGHESRGGIEVSQLVGTMASPGGAQAARLADTVQLDLDAVSGAVRLYEAGTVLVLEFDLAPRQPIDVVAAYDGHEARFSGFVEPGNRENRRYALSLAGKVDAGGSVWLSFYSAGALIHEDALQVAGRR